MFNRKTDSSLYPAAVVAALAVTVVVVFGALIEAVAGMETFL